MTIIGHVNKNLKTTLTINNAMEVNTIETKEDIDKYISCSKKNIDGCIRKNEYRKAFGLLIWFLERLDSKEQTDVIDYYYNNMDRLGVFK